MRWSDLNTPTQTELAGTLQVSTMLFHISLARRKKTVAWSKIKSLHGRELNLIMMEKQVAAFSKTDRGLFVKKPCCGRKMSRSLFKN